MTYFIWVASVLFGLVIAVSYVLGRADLKEEMQYEGEPMAYLDSWSGTLDCIGCGISIIILFVFSFPFVLRERFLKRRKPT